MKAFQLGQHRADIIVETGGQSGLARSINAATCNSRTVLIAVGPLPDAPWPNFGTIIVKSLTIKGIAEGSRAMLMRLLKAMTVNDIQPIIDWTFEFDGVRAADAYLASVSHAGKVMVRVS